MSHEERAQAEKEGLHFGRDESGGCKDTDPNRKSQAEGPEDEEETFQEERSGCSLIAEDDIDRRFASMTGQSGKKFLSRSVASLHSID